MPIVGSDSLRPSVKDDPDAKSNTLFEQLGTTDAVKKASEFSLTAVDGAPADVITPLPDIDE